MKTPRRISTRIIFACILTLTLSWLSSCAVVDQRIALTYSPLERSFGTHTGSIEIAQSDSAASATRASAEGVIGSINNVHGVHQANILADRNPDGWVMDALFKELQRTGFNTSSVAALSRDVPFGILISDITASLNVNMGTVSDDTSHELKFNADIFKNGVKVKNFTVVSRDKRTLALTASKDEKEQIMRQSLQDAMLQIVPEVIFLATKQ